MLKLTSERKRKSEEVMKEERGEVMKTPPLHLFILPSLCRRARGQICLLAFAFCLLAFAEGEGRSPYPEALDLYNSGLYQEAIIVLNQHLKKSPEDLESRTLLASAYFKIKKFDAAVKECEMILAQDSTREETKRVLTQARAQIEQDRAKRIAYYQNLLQKHPENLSYRLALARFYVQEGDYREAEKNFQEYLKGKSEDIEAWFEYAQVLSWQKKNNRAIEIYQNYLKKEPGNLRFRIGLGYALLWSGRVAEAKKEFLAVLRVDSTQREAREGLKAIAALPAPKVYVYPIDRYYAILKREPKNNQVRLSLIKELLKAKRFDEAYNECQKLLNLQPEHPEGIKLLKEIERQTLEFHQERVSSLTDYVKEHPEDEAARLNLASSLFFLEKYREAIIQLKAYLEKRPADVEARLKYAQSLFNTQDMEGARQEYGMVLKEWPDSLQIRLEFARCLFWKDRERAEQELLLILTKQPNNLDAYLTLAKLYLISGNLERAKDKYEQVLKIAPGNKGALQGLKDIEVERYKQTEKEWWEKLNAARLATGNDDYASAIPLYEEYLEENPQDWTTKLEYARVLSWAKEYDSSINVYQEILEQIPNDPELRTEFARVLFWKGDYPQAAAEYEKALALYPKDNPDVKVLLGLAEAYREMGEFDKAEREYQKILKINPYANIALVGLKSIPHEIQPDQPWSFLPVNASYSKVAAPKEFHIEQKKLTGKINLSRTLQIIPGYQHYIFRQFEANYYCNSYFFTLDYKFDPKLSAQFNLGYNLYTGQFNPIYESYTTSTAFNWRFPAFFVAAEYQIRPDAKLGLEYERKELIYATETLPALRESIFGEKVGVKGEYRYKQNWQFNGQYQYGVYSDANQSQELLFGAAYNLLPELSVGYEYNRWGYQNTSPFYWAPTAYQTHELWSNFAKTLATNLEFNAKFGFILVPGSSPWEKTLDASVYYTPLANLTLGVVLGFSTRQRDLRRAILIDAIFCF